MMPAIDATLETTVTGKVERTFETNAAADESLASSGAVQRTNVLDARRTSEFQEGWRHLINDTLIEWGNNPGRLQVEDLIPPSSRILTLASEIAMNFRDQLAPPPTFITPDGDGGLSFEYLTPKMRLVIHFQVDTTVEELIFNESGLIRRRRVV